MQKIGRYEIIDELGRGAMGVVYRAKDTQIGRIVALKVILTANASPQDIERYKQRFRREAQAAGRLSHPGIVTIHDIAEDESGQPYLVMEYIEGRPLNLLLGPTAQVPLDKRLDIGIQVAEALDYAHKSGIVHRDIKPPNILMTADGRAKIADFGIARMEGTELTQEGTSVGTPSYMSPEQFRGGQIDGRSDIFSLGAVLYWMFTGEKPFPGETVTRISFQVAFEVPTPPTVVNTSLPANLDEVLSRCMAKSPAGRYGTGAELAADLVAVRAGKPLPPRAAPPTESTGPIPLPERSTAGKPSVEDSDPNAQTRVGVRSTGSRTQPLLPEPRKRFPPGVFILGGVILAVGLSAGYWALRRASAPNALPPATQAVNPPAAQEIQSATSAAPDTSAPGTATPGAQTNPNLAANAAAGSNPAPPPVTPAGGGAGSGAPKNATAKPAQRNSAGNAAVATTPETSQQAAPAAANAPPPDSPAPTQPAAELTEKADKPVVADATLEIICNHPFKQATLEIIVDGKLLFQGVLEGKRKALTLGLTRGGRLEAKREIPSGRRSIRVRVKAPEEKYQDETTINETIGPHAVRTLKISFGEEGSAPGGGRKVHADLI